MVEMIKQMKEKVSALLATLAVAMMSAPSLVFAEGSDGGLDITVGNNGSVTFGGGASDLSTAGSSITSTMKNVLGWVTAGGIIIVVICLVVAGVLYATSQGNPQKRMQARSAITGCLIGAAVIGGASMLAGVAYGILR